MSDIFISYKREERDKARAIAEMLVGEGYDVWWDIELLPGDRFAREIDEVIKNSKAAIVLWSKKAVESDFIRAEANRAHKNQILISAKLDECEIPIPYNIHHYLDLSQWDNAADSPLLQPLLKAVEKKIGSRTSTQNKTEIEKNVEQPKAHDEIEYWKTISENKQPSIKEYEAYLKKYGENGVFHDLATLRIDEIKQVRTGKTSSFLSKISKLLIFLASIGLLVLVAGYFLNQPDPKPKPKKLKVSLCNGVSKVDKVRSNLFEAIKVDDLVSVKDCANKLRTINFHNEHGHTPLTAAAFHGNLEVVEFLVTRGANVNMTDDDKGQRRTPLHYAIQNSRKAVAKLLICKNADKNARDSLGKTPLDYDASSFYRRIRCE